MNHFKVLIRNIGLPLIGLLLLILSVGCSGASKNEVSRPAATPVAKTNAPSSASGPTAPVAKPSADIRKLIETAQITLETRDLSTTEKKAIDLLVKRKGKIDSTNVTLDSNGRRNGNYTLRVPAGQLQDYINELAVIPDVVVRQRSLSAQDVTEEVIDISARLENMRRHEIRLREILTTAKTVEEILKVEKELSSVRSQIESTTGRLKAMTGKIDMSTIQLRISEVTVITETNFFGKLKSIIRDSWVAAGDVLLYLIATVIVLSPLVILIIAIWWFWRNRRKSKSLQANVMKTPPSEPRG